MTGTTEPVFASLHRPAEYGRRDTAVLICPPFGWEEVSAYRSLRFWAIQLCRAGYPTAQISLPSTGDSAGAPDDPDRLGAWVSAFAASVSWLPTVTGARRIAVIGLGLGGIVAVLGVQAGAPVDDLVLWATPAHGRRVVRQLHAIARLEASQFHKGLPAPPELPPGEIEAGGFRLSAETVRQLDQIRLEAVPLPPAPGRRALLLGRDGMSVDPKLRDALERSGVAVSTARAYGYGTMTSHPQQTRPPQAAIERVRSWLDQAASSARQSSPAPEACATRTELTLSDGTTIAETPLTIPQSFGVLFGVLTEPIGTPVQGPCVLLLNAGAIRHIGPNRMWVDAARRWAARGVRSLRLDVEGIGDADGEQAPYLDDGALYVPRLIPQVRSALDYLQERGAGDSFVLAGLCAGAYWAFHVAIQDPRVRSVFMLNPRALIWDNDLGPARDLKTLVTQTHSLAKIRQAASGRRLLALLGWLLSAPLRRLATLIGGRPPDAAQVDIDSAIRQFEAAEKRALLVFADLEPLEHELRNSGRLVWLEQLPGVRLERILVRDHTLRPCWSQRRIHELLDSALESELTGRVEKTPSE